MKKLLFCLLFCAGSSWAGLIEQSGSGGGGVAGITPGLGISTGTSGGNVVVTLQPNATSYIWNTTVHQTPNASVYIDSFTMMSPLNMSDQTGKIIWADTSNTCLGGNTNCGRGSLFTQNTILAASAFNAGGGLNGKTWQGNTIGGYGSASLFGSNGENVYFNTCWGNLSCGGSTGGAAATDHGRITAFGNGALGGNAFANGTFGITAVGDNAGFAQTGSSNTYLGASTVETAVAGLTNNCTAVGFASACNASNAVFLGSNAPLVTTFSGPIQISTAMGTGYMMAVSSFSHLSVFPSSPTITSCGTSPNGRVTGSDTTGVITIGGGVTTACTLTFVNAWRLTPVCIISDNATTATIDISAISTTAFTVSSSATIGSGQVYYHCFGNE